MRSAERGARRPVVGSGGGWPGRGGVADHRHPRKGGAPRGVRLTRHPAGSSHSYCQLPTLRPSRSSLFALRFGLGMILATFSLLQLRRQHSPRRRTTGEETLGRSQCLRAPHSARPRVRCERNLCRGPSDKYAFKVATLTNRIVSIESTWKLCDQKAYGE